MSRRCDREGIAWPRWVGDYFQPMRLRGASRDGARHFFAMLCGDLLASEPDLIGDVFRPCAEAKAWLSGAPVVLP